MSTQQMLGMAYVIFACQPILQQDLRLWNRRPAAERTWVYMLTHFREAQSYLSSLPTAGDIFHQAPAHQANSIDAMADLVAQRLLDALPSPDTPPAPVVPTNEVNSAFQQRDSALAARKAALLTQLTEMMSMMRSGGLPSGSNNRRGSHHSSRGHGGCSYDRGSYDRSTYYHGSGRGRGFTPPAPRAYCWSHACACAHLSNQCNNQLPDHQSGATFANMQGGNTSNCFWLPT